jgi:toxin ParE1/3/4
MRSFTHDVAAENDLIGIWVYTCEEWGFEQAERYLDALELGTKKIAKEPETGKQRDELRKGYWSRRIGRHVVFYTITDSEVRIRRVLHGAMDVKRRL